MELNERTGLELVKKHLNSWSDLNVEDINFHTLHGGASSKLYVLEDINHKVKDHPKLLIRYYAGGKLYDPDNDTIGRQSESSQAVLAFKLGELGHGPRQLGLFRGGRIEEFVPNRNFCSTDIENIELVEQLARKIAIYHNMHNVVPTIQTPRDAFATIRKHVLHWTREGFLNTLNEILSEEQKSKIDFDVLTKFDFESELKWIAEKRSTLQSPLVHAHYDLNSGNILVREKPDVFGQSIMLVDYEGACMEQRGFDIATHFNFHLTDATKPNFLSDRNYPNLEYRRKFVAFYLDEWQKNHVMSECDTVDHVIDEIEINSLLHAVFLLSWWIVPSEFSLKNLSLLVTFTLMGQVMIKSYLERKQKILEKF